MRYFAHYATLLVSVFLTACETTQMTSSHDDQGIRYTLVSDKPGDKTNWVFVPGGPGADSSYLLTLTNILDLPGKVWRVDFPGSGDNPAPGQYDFHEWFKLLPSVVTRFDNCIIVGHSFGGMLPLMAPELEDKLKGLILINSAPRWSEEETKKLIKKLGVPTLPESEAFNRDKTQDNQNKRIMAYIPYWFTKNAATKGREMFEGLPFPVHTMLTVYGIMQEINYNASWVPQEVPTLIIGGERDYINPYALFEQDKRFNRENIQKALLKDCGHWCWIEKPAEVKALITQFYQTHVTGRIGKSSK